jgi:PKD domain-containing protein
MRHGSPNPTPWPRRAALALLAALAGLLVISAPAWAAPTWLPATSLSSPGQDATETQVGVDAQGDSVAVWQRADGSGNNVVQAAVRPAGGAWQPTPTNLASCYFFPATPRVAVDARGDAVAVWRCLSKAGGYDDTEASVRPAGGTWGTPVQLSDTDAGAQTPQVAIDAHGDAVAVWDRVSGATTQVESSTEPAGGSWQPEVSLSDATGSAGSPDVALAPNGAASVVWLSDDGPGVVTQAASRPAGAATWGPPVNLSNPGSGGIGQVATTPQGEVIAVWPSGADSTVQGAVRSPAGVWGSPTDISASGEAVENVAIGVDRAGTVTAVWDRSDGSDTIVQAATRPAGGAWQAAFDLSAAGENAGAAQVAADGLGGWVAVWQRSNGANTIIQAARRPAGGGWEAPVDLAPAGENAEAPAVAADAVGDATAIWDRSDGSETIAQAAGLDAGPLLDGLSIPTVATAGVPVAFSVFPLDVWSAVQSTAWVFGDGTTAGGPAPTHTYRGAGNYPVTVSSTDLLGTVSSTTATITVAPGPAERGATSPPAAPTLTRVSQTHRTWREDSRTATIARSRIPVGTTFSFTVNEPVHVSLTFTQALPGRRASGRCQAMTFRNRHSRPCRRTVTRGGLIVAVKSGAHQLRFHGRIADRRLPLGHYTADLVATNTTTHSHSASRTLGFTIAR